MTYLLTLDDPFSDTKPGQPNHQRYRESVELGEPIELSSDVLIPILELVPDELIEVDDELEATRIYSKSEWDLIQSLIRLV